MPFHAVVYPGIHCGLGTILLDREDMRFVGQLRAMYARTFLESI